MRRHVVGVGIEVRAAVLLALDVVVLERHLAKRVAQGALHHASGVDLATAAIAIVARSRPRRNLRANERHGEGEGVGGRVRRRGTACRRMGWKRPEVPFSLLFPRQPQNFFPDAHGSRLGRAHHNKDKIVWRPVRNNTCGARAVDDQESCLPSRADGWALPNSGRRCSHTRPRASSGTRGGPHPHLSYGDRAPREVEFASRRVAKSAPRRRRWSPSRGAWKKP